MILSGDKPILGITESDLTDMVTHEYPDRRCIYPAILQPS
jgi:hypothetical protein